MTTAKDLRSLQQAVWEGSVPLEIRLDPSECRLYDQADPYLIHHHRLSYLPLLLPRLHSFFSPFLITPEDVNPHDGWFSFEGVPLKWHYPLGLLYDLFSGASPSQAQQSQRKRDDSVDDAHAPLPWRLMLHFSQWPDDQLVRLDGEGKVLHDAFINSVKEADFLRNGTAKGIMTLSKSDSTLLWKSVEDHDFSSFNPLYQRLLSPQGAPLRHIPLRIYIPSSSSSSSSASESASGHLKVVQSLVTPLQTNSSRELQTLGSALHTLLPTLFPSRRTPILAKPVLHGGVVPMAAVLEDLVKSAVYLDGWLHLGVMMLG